MSGKCEGTCVFHETHEQRLTDVYEWHLGAKEREKTVIKSVKDMTTWFKRFIFTVVLSVGVQVAVLVIKAGAK